MLAFFEPQVASVAAGFAIIWALAWRHQHRAVMAIEERDGVRFYVDRTSPVSPIQLIRTPGFGGIPLLRRDVVTDVLLVSLGGTAGLREADEELAASMRRAGASVAVARVPRVREWRTMAGIELAWALSARRAAARALAELSPRAVVYSSTTAALLAPVPGAIRFDAPAAGNRPGRHGLWQRPVERRRMAAAPLLLPWSEGGLAEAPSPHAEAVVVPVPVEPSGTPASATSPRSRTGPTRRRRASTACSRRGGRREARRTSCVVAGLDAPAWRATGGAPAGVRFAGLLARDEYRALLRRARVFVTAPRREDYGIAQLEALADGCRLVTTPSPGPYAALPIARSLDPRLVSDDLAGGAADRPGRARRGLRRARRRGASPVVARRGGPGRRRRPHPEAARIAPERMSGPLLAPVHELGGEPAVSVGGEGLTYGELREAAGALARSSTAPSGSRCGPSRRWRRSSPRWRCSSRASRSCR